MSDGSPHPFFLTNDYLSATLLILSLSAHHTGAPSIAEASQIRCSGAKSRAARQSLEEVAARSSCFKRVICSHSRPQLSDPLSCVGK